MEDGLRLPSISVIVPFRNARGTLDKLAAALAPQKSLNGPVELIGVDDASSDGGADILAAAGFRIIGHPASAGPAAARNDGAVAATGDVLLFLDADVVPGPDLVAHVRERFARDPALAALSGVYNIDPANEGFFPKYKAHLCHAWFEGKTRFGCLETACAAIRREAFLETGGFNETYAGAEVEDYEFGYRLAGKDGIEIDHEMSVKHHFPGLFENLLNFAVRGYLWARLKRPRVFDPVATTPREAASAACTWCVAGVLAAMLVTGNEWFAYLLVLFLGLHLEFRRAFYMTCHDRQGPPFTVLAVLVTLLGDLVVVPAVALGTFARLLRIGGSKAAVRTVLLLMLCLLFASKTAHAQTDLRAWSADGQTWLVFQTATPDPFTYDFYKSSVPITDLASAELIGRLFPQDASGLRLALADPTAHWRIPDGEGGEYLLADGEGLFAYTPYDTTPEYFAVVRHGDEAVGPDNSTGPIAQALDPVVCHFQFSGTTDDGRAYKVYAHWIDGLDDWNAGRADYPVMGNAGANGTAYLFAVADPASGRPAGAMPLVMALHGGGDAGGYIDFWGRINAYLYIDTILSDGLLLTPDDSLYMMRDNQGTPVVDSEPTRWFGYWSGYDRFSVPAGPPPDDGVVVDYTMRRLEFILDWVLANENVDPARVALYGFSGGGGGAGFLARRWPQRFSAVTLLVPSFTGSINPLAIYMQGTITQDLATTLDGSLGLKEWYWPTKTLSDTELPFMRYVLGKKDLQEAWSNKVDGAADIEAKRLGAQIYWDERDHSLAWAGQHWTGSPRHDPQALTRFRNDQSFPAFANDDQDPAAAGRQPDIGDGNPNHGDPWGTFGGYIDWDTDSIVDAADRWEVTYFLVSESTFPADIPAFDSCTADLTIRRAQNFKPAPGAALDWTLTRVSDSTPIQSGSLDVPEDGLVTLTGLNILKDPARLAFSLPIIDDDTDDDSADDSAADDSAADDSADDTAVEMSGGSSDHSGAGCCG